ncbi:CDP-alcohol phosphatidyltransferase family protein [Microlunatus panaciterrae]
MTAEAAEATGFVAALDQLRSAQKGSKGAPPYSLYVNRPLGRYLAAAAYQLGMTPNQVTAVSALFTFSAIAELAIFKPTLWTGLLVCLGLVLGYALDSADGQLARLRGGGSTVGEWLDHIIDSAKVSVLHLAVLITAFRHFDLPGEAWLLVPIGFTLVSAVHFFGMILSEQLARVHRAKLGLPAPAKVATTPLRSLLKLPTDYGVLCALFLLLAVPTLFLWVYTALAVASAGYLLLVLVKWYRDMVALDGPRRAA